MLHYSHHSFQMTYLNSSQRFARRNVTKKQSALRKKVTRDRAWEQSQLAGHQPCHWSAPSSTGKASQAYAAPGGDCKPPWAVRLRMFLWTQTWQRWLLRCLHIRYNAAITVTSAKSLLFYREGANTRRLCLFTLLMRVLQVNRNDPEDPKTSFAFGVNTA